MVLATIPVRKNNIVLMQLNAKIWECSDITLRVRWSKNDELSSGLKQATKFTTSMKDKIKANGKLITKPVLVNIFTDYQLLPYFV